ncbi:MAG: threonine synthase [Acidimicrobiales bacterium]
MTRGRVGNRDIYVSTRSAAPMLDFGDALLTGLASDGGLYVPESWPALPEVSPSAYADLATAMMMPFVEGVIESDDLAAMAHGAYATFDHPDVCPLVGLDHHHHLLELFHGPTLAFKDIALQLVGRLFDHELERRDERVVIVGATSGDTGSAAMEAVRDRDRIDIVVLHPEGRTSEIQRRQMTCLTAPNVHAVAIDGTFDDCQDLVKAMFADEPFRARCNLAAVNSINWARVMAQIVYYAWAVQLLDRRHEPTTFCVPTGNFGNVFAGHGARLMGLGVERFIVASNTNDILSRLIETGEMVASDVVPTLSPSMDIQISSNLERLLFELLDQNGPATAELLATFRDRGRVGLTVAQHDRLREEFSGDRLEDAETLEVMARVHDTAGLLVDPHTAVAIGVAERLRRPDETVVTFATAHPAKFPDAVQRATGVEVPLPPHLADLLERPERCQSLADDLALVEDFVASVRRH